MTRHACEWRHGFTLIELLVVITIVALLISILLPAMRGAREVSRQMVCLSKQRQLGLAIQMYLDDHRGRFPGWYKWDSGMASTQLLIPLFIPYLTDPLHFRQCPSGPRFVGSASSPDYETQYGFPYSDSSSRVAIVQNGPGIAKASANLNRDSVPAPSITCMIAETRYDVLLNYQQLGWGKSKFGVSGALSPLMLKDRHGGNSGNYLFMDGHAATLKPDVVNLDAGNRTIKFAWLPGE